MLKRILVIGAGFADIWSALGAARLLDRVGRADVEVVFVAPEPELHVRPCLCGSLEFWKVMLTYPAYAQYR